eukprot:CAMPEP_0172778386 /NCGR_PEP_ID=MMETSP1074-20121228/201880_1 /TAXON_ID=2916 /ORGANISM="Ceratium fusus, Strain PA161109" /LENGTH=182 /DNA_ID=CAMNT_0013615317 /DNA_START=192 /DNA_END=740 /DNA_ORIENTATION=-
MTNVNRGAHAKWNTQGHIQMDQYKTTKNAKTNGAPGTLYAATAVANARHARSARAGVSLGVRGRLERTLYAATAVANARHARSARAGVSLGVRGRLESRNVESRVQELALGKRYAALAMASSALIVACAKSPLPRRMWPGLLVAKNGVQAKSERKNVMENYALGRKYAPGVQESAQNVISAQ